MSLVSEAHLHRYTLDDARPATFLERGVTVPFTTPLLLGSRVRPDRRQTLELAVPNPAGVRGLYIVPLRAIRDICTPTLHDRLIAEVLGEHKVVTPNIILQVTRAAAQEGLAGREAAAAAVAMDGALSGQRLLTNYTLLLLLIKQTEPSGLGLRPAECDSPSNVQARAKRAVACVAEKLRVPSEVVVTALEELAETYLNVGTIGNPTNARYQQQMNELEALAAEVAAWGEAEVDSHQAGSASLIARSASLTYSCGHLILKRLLDSLANLALLLMQWVKSSDDLRNEAGKLAWLLDGWAVILSVWHSSGRFGASNAIREMAVLVPSIPLELNRWVTGQEEELIELQGRRSRFVSRLEEWRTGRMQELIERNELIIRDFV